MASRKQELSELAARLREGAKLQDPMARAAVQLLIMSADDAKESLVTAEGEDMYRLQGAARHLRMLIREVTTEPPKIGD